MRSFHSGSSRASHVRGMSAESTAAVLTMRPSGVRNVPYQRPSESLDVAGRAPAKAGRNGSSRSSSAACMNSVCGAPHQTDACGLARSVRTRS